jgi:hypothetical protein
MKDYFTKYFTSPQGIIPLQYDKVLGMWCVLKKYSLAFNNINSFPPYLTMLGQGYVVYATVSENINWFLNARMIWPKMWFFSKTQECATQNIKS